MTIYLLRHGQATTNVERRISGKNRNGDLTALGQEQARRAGDWLRNKGITVMRTSPFHRAEQTAQIVGQYLDLVPTMDDDLREIDGGMHDMKNDDAAWDAWRVIYERWKLADFDATFPDGESYRQGFDRFQRALLRCERDVNTVLVTHAGIVRTIVPYLCVNAAALQNIQAPQNCGIVTLSYYDAHRFACDAWDITEHLA